MLGVLQVLALAEFPILLTDHLWSFYEICKNRYILWDLNITLAGITREKLAMQKVNKNPVEGISETMGRLRLALSS